VHILKRIKQIITTVEINNDSETLHIRIKKKKKVIGHDITQLQKTSLTRCIFGRVQVSNMSLASTKRKSSIKEKKVKINKKNDKL